jgi:proline dehydrogenase
MLNHAWQSLMIAVARSPRLKSLGQVNRATSFLVDRYVGGKNQADGVSCALELQRRQGIRSSLFYLGKYVDDADLVRRIGKNPANAILLARSVSS